MEKALTVQVAGADFYAQQQGDTIDTVFIHGFGDDLSTWDRLWVELGDSLSALRYDLRGFGQSTSHSDAPFSHSEDLGALLTVLGVERCNVVGVSMGGAIALNYALHSPQRVNRLVMISPGLVAWEWSDSWKALWRPILAAAQEGRMQEARELWWQHPLFARTRASEAADDLYASIMRYSGQQWLGDHERDALPDVDQLHKLQTAALMITGSDDVEEFRLIASLIENGAPGVARVDLPGVGHLPNIEAPGRCAELIQAFLTDNA